MASVTDNEELFFTAMLRTPDNQVCRFRFTGTDIDSARARAATDPQLSGYTVIRVHCHGTHKPNQMGFIPPDKPSRR